MRKVVTMVLVLGLFAAFATPASAGKKKVEEEWTATAPIPNPAQTAAPGCGVEAVNFSTHPFTTPAKGILDVSMDQFQGDWDLYVKDADGNILGQSAGFIEATVERVVIPLGAKEDIIIETCNYAGGPTAHGFLTYTYKA